MKVRQAVVMVGGKGTRLMPLTETKPKPILSVADKPCIWYLIRSLARAGIEEVILACGYKPGMMEELGDGSDLGISIRYAYENEPRGTAGAIKLLEDQLDDTFVASNGDVFADIDVAEEIRIHQESEAFITIALTSVDNPCDYGIARLDHHGRIVEFKDKPKKEEVFSNYINAGVYVVSKEALSYVPLSSFFDFSMDLVPLVISKGYLVQSYPLSGMWIDVGRPHDLVMANLVVAENQYRDFDWPTRNSTVNGAFYLGPNSSFENSKSDSSVVLSGSHVEGSNLDHSLVMANCSIRDSVIVDSVLGEGCVVGPGSVIRGAVLADNTIIEAGKSVGDSCMD